MGYSELVTAKVGKRRWQLKRPWRTPYCTVPKGFITDGATIPRIAWAFTGPGEELFEAAVIHDYLYAHGIGDKRQADKAFYKVALDHGVKQWKAWIAYQAVKIFGRGMY